jgi:hypothetical protein
MESYKMTKQSYACVVQCSQNLTETAVILESEEEKTGQLIASI